MPSESNEPAPPQITDTSQGRHQPVLLREVLDLLAPQPGDTYVDCTAGLGGHAFHVAEKLGPTGTVVLFDLDPHNLAAAKSRLESLPNANRPARIVPIHASFSDAARRLTQEGIAADLVLADLGFASNQVESPARGLSFSRDGPLDMRLDPTSPITAAELVNTLSQRELMELLRDLGEERSASRIAEKIVAERRREPIQTTARLAAIARTVIGKSPGHIDPATRTFQALRIAVNDELGRLGVLLDSIGRAAATVARQPAADSDSRTWIRQGARVAIISFHSLEDRPVKRAFASLVERGTAAALTKKPVQATDDEVRTNPRSRSAKMRVIRLAV